MVSMVIGASCFPISSSNHSLDVMISGKLGGIPIVLNMHKNKRKSASSPRLRVQANANVPAKQTFAIRSYEIGADGKATIETVMNHLQEAVVTYGKVIGVLGYGLDSSSYGNLIWVMTRMQVEVDRYPTWGDFIQINEPCLTTSGKHGFRLDWLIHDCKTSEVLVRASSNMAMMNKSTRRLLKISDEIRATLEQFIVDRPLDVIVNDTRILRKLDETNADHVCSGLMPRWSDLDLNAHVNNVKYIGWILESVPNSIVTNYELTSMTLVYHQECGKDSILQSLTSVLRNDNEGSSHVECHHMLRLEDGGGVIMKGWTMWRPNYQKIY